jgi:hypothetical protein
MATTTEAELAEWKMRSSEKQLGEVAKITHRTATEALTAPVMHALLATGMITEVDSEVKAFYEANVMKDEARVEEAARWKPKSRFWLGFTENKDGSLKARPIQDGGEGNQMLTVDKSLCRRIDEANPWTGNLASVSQVQ